MENIKKLNFGKSQYVSYGLRNATNEPDMIVEIPIDGKLSEAPDLKRAPSGKDGFYCHLSPKFSGTGVEIPLEREKFTYEHDIILNWIKERNEWIAYTYEKWDEGGYQYDEHYGSPWTPGKEDLEDLLKAYGLSKNKVDVSDALTLSPSRLNTLSNKLDYRNTHEFIYDLLKEVGFENEANSEWFEKNIDEIRFMPENYRIERGYTSLGVLINNEWAIKFDSMPRIGIENEIYTSSDFYEFKEFTPNVKNFNETIDGKFGALILENLNLRPVDGCQKAIDIAANKGINLKTTMDYNLFLMGLFHKCSNDDFFKKGLTQVIYEDKQKIPHDLSMDIPSKNKKGEGYKRFSETSIKVESLGSIIENYNYFLKVQLSQKKLVPIHGDWKPENMVQGYLVDFAMVGLAKEIDELAYFLSDARMNFNLNQYHQVIDRYIEIRSKHDRKYEIEMFDFKRKETHEIADSALLRQIVLRHSVMKKRDMLDKSKYLERKYYQSRIKDVLKKGTFI